VPPQEALFDVLTKEWGSLPKGDRRLGAIKGKTESYCWQKRSTQVSGLLEEKGEGKKNDECRIGLSLWRATGRGNPNVGGRGTAKLGWPKADIACLDGRHSFARIKAEGVRA